MITTALVSRALPALVAALFSICASGSDAQGETRFHRYFQDTWHSLETLRAPEGLVSDRRGKLILNSMPTSPTNIAFDLLTQLEALHFSSLAPKATRNLQQTVTILQNIDRAAANGLFYSRYLPGKPFAAVDKTLSSIDNLHLALALWTVAQTVTDAPLQQAANSLFQKMDFSGFYAAERGLFHGTLRLVSHKWVPDQWSFGYFGSESRSLYSLAFSLGLIKDPHFLKRAFSSLFQDFFLWTTEQNQTHLIMAVWDGGTFQMLLPEILLGESHYSAWLPILFSNFSKFLVAEEKRRHLPLPAAHSACQTNEESIKGCPPEGCYTGKAGSLATAALANLDTRNATLRSQWESVITPHALFMAATVEPQLYNSAFAKMEHLGLYKSGQGFWDGYRLTGLAKDKVIHEILALDQGMIALSVAKMMAPDQLSVSARALSKSNVVQKRLFEFYSMMDHFFIERTQLQAQDNALRPMQLLPTRPLSTGQRELSSPPARMLSAK